MEQPEKKVSTVGSGIMWLQQFFPHGGKLRREDV